VCGIWRGKADRFIVNSVFRTINSTKPFTPASNRFSVNFQPPDPAGIVAITPYATATSVGGAEVPLEARQLPCR
jgi:hypothetical protein